MSERIPADAPPKVREVVEVVLQVVTDDFEPDDHAAGWSLEQEVNLHLYVHEEIVYPEYTPSGNWTVSENYESGMIALVYVVSEDQWYVRETNYSDTPDKKITHDEALANAQCWCG